MTGNLSHQIEHHLFPDLPSNRYAEVAPRVQALFEKYDLNYHSAPLPQQVYSAWHKVVRLSLPNGWLATTNARNLPRAGQAALGDVDQGPPRPPRRPGPPAAAGPPGGGVARHAGGFHRSAYFIHNQIIPLNISHITSITLHYYLLTMDR